MEIKLDFNANLPPDGHTGTFLFMHKKYGLMITRWMKNPQSFLGITVDNSETFWPVVHHVAFREEELEFFVGQVEIAFMEEGAVEFGDAS